MSGSAVLFRKELFERAFCFYRTPFVVLDEKPNLDEIPEGTAIVGEDQRGNLKEGKIKRLCSSIQCTIETDGEEWQSKLENVRVFRKELCENHVMT